MSGTNDCRYSGFVFSHVMGYGTPRSKDSDKNFVCEVSTHGSAYEPVATRFDDVIFRAKLLQATTTCRPGKQRLRHLHQHLYQHLRLFQANGDASSVLWIEQMDSLA